MSKILFITRTYPPHIGGMQKLSFELTTRIPIDKTILTFSGNIFLLPVFILFTSVYILLNHNNFRIIHLGDPTLSFIGWLAKILFRKTVIVTLHGLDITYPNPIYQYYLKRFNYNFDKYICISNSTYLIAQKNGYSNLSIIKPGISNPQSEFRNRGESSRLLHKSYFPELEISKNTIILCTLGRLVPRKGHDWFINHVFPLLPKNYIYLIAGKGENKSKIEKSIQINKLESRVILLNEIDEFNKNILLNGIDILILPNISIPNNPEGFGIVALEASIYGVPVIATDIEGLKEAVLHPITGYLAKEKNPQDFVKKIEKTVYKLQNNLKIREKISHNTYKVFGWNKIINNYVDLFNKYL